MRRRVVAVIALLALCLVGVLLWRRSRPGPTTPKEAPDRARTPDIPDEDLSAEDDPEDDDNPRPPVRLGHVAGTARDAVTGAAIAGIDVLFSRDGLESTATTDRAGRYAVDLAPGRYLVLATGDDLYGFSPGRADVTAGARVDPFDVRVVRLAHLSGRVVDGAGEPVAGAEVSFETRAAAGIHPRSQDIVDGTAQTDAAGQFQLRAVPGAVTLSAVRGSARGRLHLSDVAPAAALSGLEIVIEVGATVSGVVREPTGAEVAGALVVLVPASGLRQRTRSGGDGRFQFADVAPGRARLAARAAGYAPSDEAAVELVSTGTSELTLTLRTAATISGRVVDAHGVPAAGARVAAQERGSFADEAVTSTDDNGRFELAVGGGTPLAVRAEKGGHGPAFADELVAPATGVELRLGLLGAVAGKVTDERGAPISDFTLRAEPGSTVRFAAPDGTFRIDDVPPRAYEIVISATGHAPSHRRVVVPEGGVGDASMVLGTAATVEGEVRSAAGGPVVGARVSGLTGFEGEGVYTGADGRFVLGDLGPGRRSLVVEHPDFVVRNEGGVELTAGERRSITVTLTPKPPGADKVVEFAGIGAVLALEGERVVIRSLVSGGAAEAAGLLPDDEVISVDDLPCYGRALAEVIEQIRGVAGTRVRLEIGRGERFRIEVVRQVVRFN